MARKPHRYTDYVFEECVLLLRANNYGVINEPGNMVYIEDNQTKKIYLVEKSKILSWCEENRANGRIIYSAYAS